MDITAVYVYGFKDLKYNNTYLFDIDTIEDFNIQIFSENVFGNACENVCYGIDIKPGTTVTVEQEKKIKNILEVLKNKYKNTENLQIGYYVGVLTSDFDGDFNRYEEK